MVLTRSIVKASTTLTAVHRDIASPIASTVESEARGRDIEAVSNDGNEATSSDEETFEELVQMAAPT